MTTSQRTLNVEVKLPKGDEHHFMQVHSTSAVCTLKSKIFSKASSLSGENPDNYVVALKQHSKVEVLPEDKIIGTHPWLEGDLSKNVKKNIFVTLYVMPKQQDSKHATGIRRKDSHNRISVYDENRFLLSAIGRNHSSKALFGGTTVHKKVMADDSGSANAHVEKPSLVRSKSEPILHTVGSGLTDMSELSLDLLSSEFDSIDSEDDDSLASSHSNAAHDDAAQISPKVPARGGGGDARSSPSSSSAVSPSSSDTESMQSKKGKRSSSKLKDSSSCQKDATVKVKKNSRWSIWQKKEGEGSSKETKRSKNGSMSRADSGGVPLLGSPQEGTTSKNNEHSSTTATTTTTTPNTTSTTTTATTTTSTTPTTTTPPVMRKTQSQLPPPADYSLKRTNPLLTVEEDNGKLVLMAGNVEQLVLCLADRDIPDTAYLDEFFYSMNYFINALDLVKMLRARYEYLPPADASTDVVADHDKWRPIIQQRVVNVMRYIMDNHWYHFERESGLLPLYKEFVDDTSVKQNPRAKALRDAVLARTETVKERNNSNTRQLRGNSSPPAPDTPLVACSPMSTDLANHRSPSSPIIVWRSRRDTLTDSPTQQSKDHHHHNNNTHSHSHSTAPSSPQQYDDHVVSSTPTSLTTVASSNLMAPPKSMGKRFKDFRKVSFMRVHPLEMARQMTLIEKELFRAIRPPEVIGGNFKKKNRAEISPNVVQMIDWFNHITTWVQKEVVMTPNLKERSAVLAQFIQVAAYLRELGNLSGAMQIVCALDTVSVKRLQKTWKGLTRKDALLWSSLEESLTSLSNYANYRKLVHEPTNGGLIPYIGVVLQDLLMIEELPTTLPNGMVNFRKMRRFASVLRSEILERQATLNRFNFEQMLPVQEYLARHIPLDEQALYRFSRVAEPSKMV